MPIAQGIVGAEQIDYQMLDANLLVCQAAEVEGIDGAEHAQAVLAAGDDFNVSAIG